VAVTVATLPATVDLACYQGDTWTQTLRFLTDDTPIDLTAIEFTAACRDRWDRLAPLTVTVTDPADGTIELSLPAGGLPAGLYEYDIQADDELAAVSTWVRGGLQITQDVTP
jgi:hypothetical protein